MVDPALVAAVVAVARDAAAMALERRHTGFRQWEKTPGHPVSDVDLAVDRMARARLAALLPDAGWLSEETADDPRRLDRRRLWLVDPIDGTRDYIRGRPGWCVSIALVEDGQPVIGVLDAPARGERWMAAAGGGAFRNDLPVRPSERDDLAGARVPTDTLPHADPDLTTVTKPNSIALRIAMVAAADADLLTTQRWGNEWDIGAATVIAREAGAWMSDGNGEPLGFNRRDPRAFGLIAAAPRLADQAVARFGPRARAIFRP